MSTAMSVRLPGELEKSLRALSRLIDRPKSYLVCKALEAYLSDYAEYQIALDRLRDKDDALLSGFEIRKRLGR